MRALIAALLLAPSATAAAGVDVAPALDAAKKPKWDCTKKSYESLEKGHIQARRKEWEKAAEYYVAALAHQPGCGEGLKALQDVLGEAQLWDEAKKVIDYTVETWPEKESLLSKSVGTLIEAGDFDSAMEITDKILALDDKSLTGHKWKVKLLVRQSQFDLATAHLGAAETAEQLKENDLACLRITVHALNEDLEAAEPLKESCDESESSSLRKEANAWLAFAQGDAAEAAKYFQRMGYSSNMMRITMAQARLDEDKPEGALNLTNLILEEDGDALDARVLRARVLLAMDKPEDALAEIDAIITHSKWVGGFDVEEAKVVMQLGGASYNQTQAVLGAAALIEIHHKMGDDQKGHTVLDQALEAWGESEILKEAGAILGDRAPDSAEADGDK